MKTPLILKILIIFLAATCNAPISPASPASPSSPTDSLLNVTLTGSTQEKMKAFYDLSIHYSRSNVHLTRQYAHELLRLSQQEKDKEREADSYSYSCFGDAYSFLSKYDSAMLYYQKALILHEEVKNEVKATDMKLNIAHMLGYLEVV